jgi:hypothetical protein
MSETVHITDACVVFPLVIQVTFNNGKTALLEANTFASGLLLDKMKDCSFFADVAIIDEGCAVQWSDGPAICVDSLYTEAFGTRPNYPDLGNLEKE